MIIGVNKDKVIENIKKSTEMNEFNCKVEVDDPNLTGKEKSDIVNHYLSNYTTFGYKFCNICARAIIDTASKVLNCSSVIEGLENVPAITNGAIVTSNHFNPLDNTIVRQTMYKAGCRRMFIVSQETNLAMSGIIGFLMNHADIIPITNSKKFMNSYFPDILEEKLRRKKVVLIYPEQEMWFNYKKPRPPKRGAYYYAASNHVPVISCFVEIQNLPKKENDQFYRTRYIMHVLPTIYPDQNKSVRENSQLMMETDYRQKVEAYEKAYGKKLDYKFTYDDIAGYMTER